MVPRKRRLIDVIVKRRLMKVRRQIRGNIGMVLELRADALQVELGVSTLEAF
jgi:hypothetical protein